MNTAASDVTQVSEITDADERHARAAWSIITEPGDGAAGELVQRLGHVAALNMLRSTPERVEDLAPGLAERALPRLRDDAITGALTIAEGHGIRLVDPSTVPGLADLGPHAPHVLWVRGDITALNVDHRIALVGSRAASSYGVSVCARLAADLVAAGVGVHSGGAYGIDGDAHRAALANGGSTVAWLAGGVDRMYPVGHTALADRIASTPKCALVSEVAPGSGPTRWRFLARNRLLAAATQATLIVEAGAKSGSLNTAGHAVTLGRPFGAVPGPVDSPASIGCHQLLRERGAVLIASGADALDLLGATCEKVNA